MVYESESFDSGVCQKQFWDGISVWINSPHVANRRLCGVKTLFLGLVLEPLSRGQVVEQFLRAAELQKSHHATSLDLDVPSFLESIGVKVKTCPQDVPAPGEFLIKIRKLLPKNPAVFQPCIEAALLDGPNIIATFIHLGPPNSTLSPQTPYSFRFKRLLESDECLIELSVCQENNFSPSEEGADGWLRNKLFPRLYKWITNQPNTASFIPEKSLSLVDLNDYNEKYQQLKVKYGAQMVEIWPEQTDPLKFVYEDLAIASYLLCLWGQNKERKCSFVDLGCGNGLLVHILSSEGHPGLGLDVRSRKLWALYPSSTKLKVQTVIPSAETTFSEFDWVIGNHSDELTPWIPVMAALSSPQTSFFVLPCCPYDFWGKYQRVNPSNSQYSEYIGYTKTVGEMCGFTIEVDKLRIPSTKRTCLIGRRRCKQVTKTVIWEYVTSRKQCGQEDFTPRPAQERVRNCTKLAAGVAATVVKLVADCVLEGITSESSEWQAGRKIPLAEAANLLSADLRIQLKSECGGLQTLLRNHHSIFLVQGGMVTFRKPKPSVRTDASKWKNKPCWFYLNHPQGCPLNEDYCSYDHKQQP